MEQFRSWESNIQMVKKFPTFYGTGSFITVFTRAPPLVRILLQMNPVHNLLTNSLKIRSNIILPSTSMSSE
jgi:hypothetical protein